MTQHLHSTFVEGCYRCDLSRDEMTADVNVTEKMARAMWASWNPHGPRWHQTDDRSREETRSEARKALGVLADPEVLAGIAGVLDEHDMGRLTSGRPYCWTHHTHDPLHLAAAVAERLTGGAR